jgi:hypothetical protein
MSGVVVKAGVLATAGALRLSFRGYRPDCPPVGGVLCRVGKRCQTNVRRCGHYQS